MRQTKPNKVINRRKKSKDFTQIYNAPIHDLGDLAAVGLLTYSSEPSLRLANLIKRNYIKRLLEGRSMAHGNC